MNVTDTHAEIVDHCAEIAELFKPGAKVTVLVRNPGRGQFTYSADMLVSDDDSKEVIKSIRYLEKRPFQNLGKIWVGAEQNP